MNQPQLNRSAGNKTHRSAGNKAHRSEGLGARDVIITADDFGLDVAVNQAVEQAHCQGILTAASLMVGAPAAADAVERARRLPALRVGLHVVLVQGRPVLPPEQVPDLVGETGELSDRLVRAGFSWFFRPRVRRHRRSWTPKATAACSAWTIRTNFRSRSRPATMPRLN